MDTLREAINRLASLQQYGLSEDKRGILTRDYLIILNETRYTLTVATPRYIESIQRELAHMRRLGEAMSPQVLILSDLSDAGNVQTEILNRPIQELTPYLNMQDVAGEYIESPETEISQ